MKNVFSRWFARRDHALEVTAQTPRASMQSPPLVLRPNATFAIVDWDAMDAHAPATEDPALLDEFWTVTARAWLEALRAQLGDRFTIRESERFQLLSALDEREGQSVLAYIEKTRKRIGRVLDGIAQQAQTGKACVLIFEDHDQYYRYVSNYHSDEGEFSLSAGMFLHYGYGHFVFVRDHMSRIEPTIAHELTHCMLQHLPIPMWLNEGIAVNTERRLSPPGPPLYTPEETHRKHLAFWDETTIQQFWSGKSWQRHDDGNSLSYDLAAHMVAMSSSDFARFREFANAADSADSGDAAARAHLGYPVSHLVEAVLGDGPWAPDPTHWARQESHVRHDATVLAGVAPVSVACTS